MRRKEEEPAPAVNDGSFTASLGKFEALACFNLTLHSRRQKNYFVKLLLTLII